MVQEICFSEVAEILRWIDPRETDYIEFWPRFKMKTPKTLNIYVPYANKPSNGYGIWETARGKIF
jgi:hypothetical protein